MYVSIPAFIKLIHDERVVNYCYSKNGPYWIAYLMGEGAEQDIAHTIVNSREEIDKLYIENGVKRYFAI